MSASDHRDTPERPNAGPHQRPPAGQRTNAITPRSNREFARLLGQVIAAGRPVRVRGNGTKLGWGSASPRDALALRSTALLDHRIDANTASFGSGTPLARAHTLLARSGRMLALDPPVGPRGEGATLGGIIASGDSGPLSYRFGGPREQLVSLTAALSDGSLVSSQAGDSAALLELVTGSYGTLAAILEVTVNTQPLPTQTTTVAATATAPQQLLEAITATEAVSARPDALDLAWHDGSGGLLALFSEQSQERDAQALAQAWSEAGLGDADVHPEGNQLWARQRGEQRSRNRAIAKVDGPPNLLPRLLELADELEASVVGRAAAFTLYLALAVNRVAPLRAKLPAGCAVTVTDLPVTARGTIEVWPRLPAATLELQRQTKRRFDPTGLLNQGVFLGGI